MADSAVVGELTVSEMRSIEMLRNRSSQITYEIGSLEVKKAALLSSLVDIDKEATSILTEAAARLGIPSGEIWHIDTDGKVRKGSA